MSAENMSRDLQERAKSCESMEEVRAMAEEEGLELSDEMLEGISGGAGMHCPHNNCFGHGCEEYHIWKSS